MFRSDNVIASIKRPVYVDGKSNSLTLIGTHQGYMTVAGPESELVDLKKLWDVYRFSTEFGADIQKSDIAIVDGLKYNVSAVMWKKWWWLGFTRVILIAHD